MAVVADDIKTRWATDFGSTVDATVTSAITEAERCMSSAAWGSRYDDGVQHLAAHILTQDAAGKNAKAGPVVGESVLGDSVRYASPQAGKTSDVDMDLMSTSYGRRYLGLRRLNFPARVC